MPSTPALPYDPLQHLRTDAVRFLEIVTDHGFETEVPSCPDWNLGDLAWHLGTIWNMFGQVVSNGITTTEELRALGRPERPSDALLIDWVTAAHTSMYSALTRADPDDQFWTFTGSPQDLEWVMRRMVQETAMHRADASHAVGIPYEVPTSVAADGIDEFLMWYAGRGAAEDAAPVGGTVHLHCTDIDDQVSEGADDRSAAGGEWLVTDVGSGGATFTREHAKGDAAVRGRAHDLLMWVWRRPADDVDIIGDTGVAERFQAISRL